MTARTKKILIIGAGVLLLGGLSLLGVIAFFAAKLVDSQPIEKSAAVVSHAQFECLAPVASELANCLLYSGGEETKTLTLDKRQVNVLLALMTEKMETQLNRETSEKANNRMECEFDGEIFHLRGSKSLGTSTPFGRYLNFDVRFVPTIGNGGMKLDLKSAKLGDFGVSKKWGGEQLENLLNSDLGGGDAVELMGKAIQDMRVENGNVVIDYKPAYVRELILSKVGNIDLNGMMNR